MDIKKEIRLTSKFRFMLGAIFGLLCMGSEVQGLASHGMIMIFDESEMHSHAQAMTGTLDVALQDPVAPVLTTGALLYEYFFGKIITGRSVVNGVLTETFIDKKLNFDWNKWFLFEVPTQVLDVTLYLFIPKGFKGLSSYLKSNPRPNFSDSELRLGLKIDSLNYVNIGSGTLYDAFKNVIKNTFKVMAENPPNKLDTRSNAYSKAITTAICQKVTVMEQLEVPVNTVIGTDVKTKKPIYKASLKKEAKTFEVWESSLFIMPRDYSKEFERRKKINNSYTRLWFNTNFPMPTWAFVMTGHGATYFGFDEAIVDAKNEVARLENEKIRMGNMWQYAYFTVDGIKISAEDFLKQQIKKRDDLIVRSKKEPYSKPGSLAALTGEDMSMILDFSALIVKFFFLETCYSGGTNINAAIRESTKQVQKDYPFILVIAGITGAPSSGSTTASALKFGLFFKELATREVVLKSEVEDVIAPICVFYYSPNIENVYAFNNIPLIKYPGFSWMQAASLTGRVESIERVLANTRSPDSPLNVAKLYDSAVERLAQERLASSSSAVIISPGWVQVYAKKVNYPLILDKSVLLDMPIFQSMITGSVVHEFVEIKAPAFAMWDFINAISPFSNLQEDKVFIFDKVVVKDLLTGEGYKKIIVIHHGKNGKIKPDTYVVVKSFNQQGVEYPSRAEWYEVAGGVWNLVSLNNSVWINNFNKLVADISTVKHVVPGMPKSGYKNEPRYLLLYADKIPFPLFFDASKLVDMPVMLSMIPGAAVHELAEIRAPGFKKADVMNAISALKDLQEDKVFILNKVVTSDLNNQKYVKIIFVNKHKDSAFAPDRWMLIKLFDVNGVEQISNEEHYTWNGEKSRWEISTDPNWLANFNAHLKGIRERTAWGLSTLSPLSFITEKTDQIFENFSRSLAAIAQGK